MTVQYNGKQVQATVTDEVGIVLLSALPWRVLRDVIFSARDAAVTKPTSRARSSRLLRLPARASCTASGGSTECPNLPAILPSWDISVVLSVYTSFWPFTFLLEPVC